MIMTSLKSDLYDIVIIGGGPAGLSAAIYASREQNRVLVIEKSDIGGLIALTDMVENYPGVGRISGKELTERMHSQAEKFGAEFVNDLVTGLDVDGEIKTVRTEKGQYRTLGIILASGVRPRHAGFIGEEEWLGRGVSLCATCDGPLFAGCQVFVVGGGMSAVQESKFLAQFASKVTILIRGKKFSCGAYASDSLKEYKNIEVRFETVLKEVRGTDYVDMVILEDLKTGRRKRICSPGYTDDENSPIGVFVFVGYEPSADWIPEQIERGPGGYIVSDANRKTSVDGVYVAGDLCEKPLRQAVTAASDGAIAAVSLGERVLELRQKIGEGKLAMPEEKAAYSAAAGNAGSGFGKDEDKAVLNLWLDDSPLAAEMVAFFEEKTELRERTVIRKQYQGREGLILPAIEICDSRGESSGIFFHSVPKGMEWDSFLMSIFMVTGHEKKINPLNQERIRKIDRPLNIKIFASLTCANCPSAVMAANELAAHSEKITAEMFDITQFPSLLWKHHVRSVPLLLINDKVYGKGRMNLSYLLDMAELYIKSSL